MQAQWSKHKLAGHLVVATSCAVLLFGLYVTGGPSGSQTGSLLVLIPVMAFFLLGSAAGWAWTIFALAVYGFFTGLSLKGYQFPTHLAENGNIVASIFIFYTVMITASFVYTYEQFYRNQLKARLREQKKFEYMAMHDPLTNLANRKLFNETFDAALARANREKYSTALLMIDLDHFKPVNDLHGHQIGDAILVHVAQSLQSAIRSSDLAARLGGDEFAIILEHVTHSDIALVADKLLAAINKNLQFDINGSVEVSCSIGVAISNPSSEIKDQSALLYGQADKALYKAKLKRNTWCFVNENDTAGGNPDISKTINHQSEVNTDNNINESPTAIKTRPQLLNNDTLHQKNCSTSEQPS